MTVRYVPSGDEFIFVELSEDMSLEAFFKGMAITKKLEDMQVPGVLEICPANASYQVRFDPDIITVDDLLGILKKIEAESADVPMQLKTRLIDIPVFFNDPWTTAVAQKFRDRHQEPDSKNDMEYAAKLNGYESVQAFFDAYVGSPWFVSMVGFVAGLPFLFQMVERDKQIEVPKYLSPRTDTPKQTVAMGGCFSCIYAVQGAGGYQMFGITPIPIFDPEEKGAHMNNEMVFFHPGDIVRFVPINQEEYDRYVAEAEAGTIKLNIKEVDFDTEEFLKDPVAYNRQLLEG
ncbi:5-oxoprolinase subunit B family protein [Ignatzschineria sp. LJL83]